MRAIGPYQVLPPAVKTTIAMLHHNDPHLEFITDMTLDPRDPSALADFLQSIRARNVWVYSVNNLAQIVEAQRRGYTFRIVEMFNPARRQSFDTAEVSAIFQADRLEGIHRIWMNQEFVRTQADIPKLDRVSFVA